MPVRALLLLPQDFSLYVKWQERHCIDAEIGQVADALEYRRFIKHRDARIDGVVPLPAHTGPQTASECGHELHPSDMIMHELCPICEVEAHLSFLDAITIAWKKAGGPKLGPGPGKYTRSKSYMSLRASWHTARCDFQDLLDMFAVMDIYEEDWEVKHPSDIAAARKTNCASAAIKLAQEESRYPARVCLQALPKVKKMRSEQGSKKVTFSPSVQIKDDQRVSTSATKFVRGRPRSVFCRHSSSYEPGEHVCPPGSEFVDTFQTNCAIADINNMKIYITDDEEAFDKLQANPYFFAAFVGEHEGLVGLHELRSEIFRVLHDLMAQGLQQKRDLESLTAESDRTVVLIDEEMGGVVDVFLFDGDDDEEDEDSQESSSKRRHRSNSSDWTCLRECLQ